jgi:membrane associated rhomboid family serine protease
MSSSFQQDIRQNFLPRYGAIGWLIVLNVGVYLAFVIPLVVLFLAGQSQLMYRLYLALALPADPMAFLMQPWSLVTHMFMHDVGGFFTRNPIGSIFHLLFNMLWLFWIGRILKEYQPGHRIWFLYLAGALLGAAAYMLVLNLSPAFDATNVHLVGASAGVTAIVIGTATLLPNFGIPMLFFGMVRLKWLAIIFLFIDFISIMGRNPGGMIAHLGGALLGFLYMRSVVQGTDWAAGLYRLLRVGDGTRRRPKSPLRVVKGSAKPKATPTGQPGKPSQTEVDRILDKIAKVGYEKLTQEEKQTLFDASRD